MGKAQFGCFQTSTSHYNATGKNYIHESPATWRCSNPRRRHTGAAHCVQGAGSGWHRVTLGGNGVTFRHIPAAIRHKGVPFGSNGVNLCDQSATCRSNGAVTRGNRVTICVTRATCPDNSVTICISGATCPDNGATSGVAGVA